MIMASSEVLLLALFTVLLSLVNAEDPYWFHTWNVNYATLSPLGVPQQVRMYKQ